MTNTQKDGDIIARGASCLIRTREYEIGFPPMFTHYPADMPEDDIKKLYGLASDALGNDLTKVDKERDGVRRRVVIRQGDYLVMGICSFLSDFLQDPDNLYNGFRDRAKRPVYGFFGFVWNLASPDDFARVFKDDPLFPHIDSFRELAKTMIVRHWFSPGPLKDGLKSDAAWQDGIEVRGGFQVPFNREVLLDADSYSKDDRTFWYNTSGPDHIVAQHHKYAGVALTQAIQRATCMSSNSSLCTNLSLGECSDSAFMNATANDNELLDHAKHMTNRLYGEMEPKERTHTTLEKDSTRINRPDEKAAQRAGTEKASTRINGPDGKAAQGAGTETRPQRRESPDTRCLRIAVTFQQENGIPASFREASDIFEQYLNGQKPSVIDDWMANAKNSFSRAETVRQSRMISLFELPVAADVPDEELERQLNRIVRATEKALKKRGATISVRAKIRNDSAAEVPAEKKEAPQPGTTSVDIDRLFGGASSAPDGGFARRGSGKGRNANDPFQQNF